MRLCKADKQIIPTQLSGSLQWNQLCSISGLQEKSPSGNKWGKSRWEHVLLLYCDVGRLSPPLSPGNSSRLIEWRMLLRWGIQSNDLRQPRNLVWKENECPADLLRLPRLQKAIPRNRCMQCPQTPGRTWAGLRPGSFHISHVSWTKTSQLFIKPQIKEEALFNSVMRK